MRMGSWRARFILQKNDAGYYTKTIAHLPYHFIPETEEAFAKIKEFVKELKAGADPKVITRFFPKEG